MLPAAMSEAIPLPQILVNLFHNGHNDDVKFDGRLERIHSNPAVYFVRNLLTLETIGYFDKKISHLQDMFAPKVVVEEEEVVRNNTSTSFKSESVCLSKNEDEIIRQIETDATGTTLYDWFCPSTLNDITYSNHYNCCRFSNFSFVSCRFLS